MRALKLAPGAEVKSHRRQEEEVIFVHKGRFGLAVDGEHLELQQGDTFTTPIGSKRIFTNPGTSTSIVYITRRHDQPQAPEFI
jgi:quercetin dioxygenase-like cupin family protein